MDSTTFSTSSKEAQVLEYAISGLYGDLLAKQYGDDLVKDVTQARDAIRDLVAKSVESREQAVYLSKKFFGENALTVMTTFQQRLAEANKAPKKSKRSSSSAASASAAKKNDKVDSKVVKLEAGESNVVEMVVDESKSKKSKTSEKDKSPLTDPKPATPPSSSSSSSSSSAQEVPQESKVDMKKMKPSAGVGKKRKVGGDSESEAS